MKNALVAWQHKEMCVASNTSGRFAYAHLNDTVRHGGHGSDGFDTLRYDGVRSAKVWRSRLGSFRKDSIWRSWVRSGGLGSARSGMIRCDPVWYHKAWRSRLGMFRYDSVRYVSVRRSGRGAARQGLARSGGVGRGGHGTARRGMDW